MSFLRWFRSGQNQAITNSAIANSAVQIAEAGRDAISFQNSHHNQLKIENIYSLFPARSLPMVDWDWAGQVIQEQRKDVRNRLKYVLMGNQSLINLDLVERPDLVNQVSLLQAERLLTRANVTMPLGRDHLMAEAFGEAGNKLLIVGAPGAGKTTELLGLAEQLLVGAIAKPQTVIPVIFELSTWKDDNQSIENWLIEQLYDLYRGDRKLKRYEQWLAQRVLLPLMDGLDELSMSRQQKCTEKLNEFARHYPQMVGLLPNQ